MMKQNKSIWKPLAAVAFAIGLAVPCAAAQGEVGVLLRIKIGVDINAVAASYGATVLGSIQEDHLYRLQSSSEGNAALIKQLTSDSRVVYVEEDSDISSAEVAGDPFHFSFDINGAPGTFTEAASYVQINLGQAQMQSLGFNVIVAVLDTGAAAAHPALQNNVMAGFNILQSGAAPADLPDGATNADVGHGTMIAGLIARLAPNAAIMPVRVMNADGKGSTFAAAQGIHYAMTHGARIITMSFSATAASTVLTDALDEAEAAGIVLVVAAGNGGANQTQAPTAGHGALVVASVEADNTKSAYSNYGSFVNVVAPGTNIRSAFWNNNYASWSGTSFAVPLVAAEAALIMATNPALTADDVVSLIRDTAHSVDGLNANFKGMLGSGVIDIDAAVRAAGGKATTPAQATVSGTIGFEGLAANAPAQRVALTFRPTDGSASFDRVASLSANGAFSFSDIPARAYTVHVHADKYLAVNLSLNATFANVANLAATLPAGDANSDNSVDSSDFGLLIGAFNSDANLPDSGYDPIADFNLDGFVDSTDFGLLIGNYGQQGDN